MIVYFAKYIKHFIEELFRAISNGMHKDYKTELVCNQCGYVFEVSHAKHASPLLKAKLRHIKCAECESDDFRIGDSYE